MTMLKIQTWRPDTHPGYIAEVEWEYDQRAGRDTGREHRGISVRYPDGTCIHRDTHGSDVAHEHYKRLHAENALKNRAFRLIVESLPARMKKSVLDSDGDFLLDGVGQPRMTVKEKSRPAFKHLGNGRYDVEIPQLDEATYRELTAKLAEEFAGRVVLLKPRGPVR